MISSHTQNFIGRLIPVTFISFILITSLCDYFQENKLKSQLDLKHVYTIGRLDDIGKATKGRSDIIYHFCYDSRLKINAYRISNAHRYTVEKKYIVKVCPTNPENSQILLDYPIEHDSFLMGDTISRMRLGLK